MDVNPPDYIEARATERRRYTGRIYKKKDVHEVRARRVLIIEGQRNISITSEYSEPTPPDGNKIHKIDKKQNLEKPGFGHDTRRIEDKSERKFCFNCGEDWPQPGGATYCPAENKTCRV